VDGAWRFVSGVDGDDGVMVLGSGLHRDYLPSASINLHRLRMTPASGRKRRQQWTCHRLP
jgi:hypothetical protein